MKKRVMKLIISVAVILLSYMFVARTVSVKAGEGDPNALWDLYVQPKDTIDVLFIGTSHSGINIDMSLFWKNKGISTYNLWGPHLPFDVTYYYLKEALKTQTPKLIVLEVFAAADHNTDSDKRGSDNGYLILNINQIKYNKNRIKTVMTSLSDKHMDVYLGLPISHSRYGKLKSSDFRYYPWSSENMVHKGKCIPELYKVRKGFAWGDPTGIKQIENLDTLTEKYLIRIIELCQEKNIPCLLVKTPTGKRDEQQPYYNRVAEIAEKYKLPFINYNFLDEETGIIPEDSADGKHLNPHGSRKIGRHLADYIATHYDLPDHRGDHRYASWDAFVKNTQTEWLQNEWELSEWFSLVKDSGESVLLVKNGNKEAQELLSMLSETLDISKEELENKDYAVWVSENPKEQLFTDRYAGGLSLEIFINSEKFYFDFYDGLNFVYKDQGIEMIEDPDWLAVVYDQESGKTMDVITINSETGDFSHLPAEVNPSGL